MKIAEIVPNQTDVSKIITELKVRDIPAPDIDEIKKQMDIDQHDINDVSLRPDKAVKDDKGSIVRIEKINRIELSLQELIVNKAVNFSLGNPVQRTYTNNTGASGATIETFVERVLRDNMSLNMDREVARNIFTYTEVAEYWYTKPLKTPSIKYGFKTSFKLACAIFTPENGTLLFPKFDEYGDLVAFSREYKIKSINQTTLATEWVTFFQTFTSDEIVTWELSALGQWEEKTRVAVTTGKMPIIYGRQKYPEYRNAKSLINRLELLLSNFAEVNDYHAGPKILVSGDIEGWGQKGQNNMILQAKAGATAKYLSWDSAPESVKNEIDNLLTQIYALTQTPNINFDNLKGMGAVSGVAIKLLFMDAHLKVKDKEQIFLPYFQRRYSVILSYMQKLNAALTDAADLIEINPSLVPFMIADDKEQAEIATTLNGNLPIKSQLTTVKEFGGDQQEYDLIQKEAKDRAVAVLGEPTDNPTPPTNG